MTDQERAEGDPRLRRRDPIPRFWAKVVRDPETECWLWIGGLTGAGYAALGVDGRTVLAHRWAFETFVGPLGTQPLDHLCRTRSCVNPEHLEPVSTRINILRGVGRSAVNARKTECKRGHLFTPENTYRYPRGRGCKICRRDASRRYKARRRGV